MLKIFRKVLFLKSFVKKKFFLFFSEEIKLNNCQKIWLRDFQWLVILFCRSSESVIYLIPKVTLKTLLKLFLKVYFKGFDQKLQNILKVILLCCIFFVIYLLWREKLRWNMFSYFAMLYFFFYLLIMASKKNLLWNMFQSFLTFTVKKEKTQRFYVIKYVKLKIYFLF